MLRVKTRPDNVRRFLQAYLERIKISMTEPDLAKQVIGKYTKTTDTADLENSYQTLLPTWERLPLIPAAAVQTMLNFATHPAAKTAKPETSSTIPSSLKSASPASSTGFTNRREFSG